MIIRRVRALAPLILVIAITWASLGVAAQVVLSNVPVAPPIVTFEQITVFVYETLAMVLLAVVGLCASAIAFVLHRDRQSSYALREAAQKALDEDHKVREEQFAVIGKAVAAVGAAVEQLVEAQKRHDESPFAHAAASHANHDPMQKQITEIGEKLSMLLGEHRTIRADEQSICAMLRKRDPKMSPHPKRATDPDAFDGRALRGHGSDE